MKRKITAFSIVFMLLVSLVSVNALDLPEGIPGTIPAPTIDNLELLKNEDGIPYFRIEFTVPESVFQLDELRPADGWVNIEIDGQIDDWGEGSTGGGGGYLNTFAHDETAVLGKTNTYYMTFDLEDEGSMTETLINARTYSYKIRFDYTYYSGPEGAGEFLDIYSPWSNELTSKSDSYYKDASSWAVAELDKAYDAGLIPEILNGADMTKPINREEFAELALILYEKTTGITTEPVAVNPFTDTTNAQILKAYKIEVTQGTSPTTFSPKVLINREQCATMLFRTIKAIAPDGDYSIEGIKDFPDQQYISEYAVQPAKYMSKLGIIKGDALTGNFMPKAVTTEQQAASYGMATREAAILMSFRTYDSIK